MRRSLDTAKWVTRQGVKLQPGLGRQAYKVDGKFKFWGGLALHIWGGGVEMLIGRCSELASVASYFAMTTL